MTHYLKYKELLEKYDQAAEKGQNLQAKILEKQCVEHLKKATNETPICIVAPYRLACYLATGNLRGEGFQFPEKGSKQFAQVMEYLRQGVRYRDPVASFYSCCAFLQFDAQDCDISADQAHSYLLTAISGREALPEGCDPIEKLVELNRLLQWKYRETLRKKLALESTEYLAQKGFFYDYALCHVLDGYWDDAFSLLDKAGIPDMDYCDYLERLIRECETQGKTMKEKKEAGIPARKKQLSLLERNLPQERAEILQWERYAALRKMYTQVESETYGEEKKSVILRETALLERVIPSDPAEATNWEGMPTLLRNYWETGNTDQLIRLHTMMTENGKADSNRVLGEIYYGKEDYAQAVSWYRKGVLAGNGLSGNRLTECMKLGRGITPEEGFRWYEELAQQGNMVAKVQEGHCRLRGIGVQRDPEKSFRMIRAAVENGCKELETDLIECYVEGIGTPANVRTALEYMKNDEPKLPIYQVRVFREPEDWGNWARRISLRARCYYVLEEYENALPLYETVADLAGNPRDLDNLARMHLNNWGFVDVPPRTEWSTGRHYPGRCNHRKPRSDEYAVSLAKRAVQMGYAPAMNLLGWCYNSGRGVARDDAEAIRWYEKSNTGIGMYNIGVCHENGNGVPKDLSIALQWYRKALENGYAKAGDRIPILEAEIKKQQEEQLRKEKEAAKQKEAHDLFEEGYRNEMGIGMEKNIIRAAELYLQASNKGHPEAMKRANDLYPALQQLKKDLENGNIDPSSLKKDESELQTREHHIVDARKELENLIGLDSVKKEIATLENMIKVNALRVSQGMPPLQVSKHMVFTGNPGTGKTTVARIVAQILKENGIVSKGQLVETDRGGLVAGFIGHTAGKTTRKVKEALGGVLFIDEAYALIPEDSSRDFGPEAVATLIKLMEDNKDDLVVIVAGYEKEMRHFIDSNPGLKSRFTTYIDFPDYTPEEMQQIFRSIAIRDQYLITEAATQKLMLLWEVSRDYANLGNGRAVRNVYEKVLRRQADRIIRCTQMDREALMTIDAEDIPQPEEVFR